MKNIALVAVLLLFSLTSQAKKLTKVEELTDKQVCIEKIKYQMIVEQDPSQGAPNFKASSTIDRNTQRLAELIVEVSMRELTCPKLR